MEKDDGMCVCVFPERHERLKVGDGLVKGIPSSYPLGEKVQNSIDLLLTCSVKLASDETVCTSVLTRQNRIICGLQHVWQGGVCVCLCVCVSLTEL